MATWDKDKDLDAARALRALDTGFLAVGHGPALPEPGLAMERRLRVWPELRDTRRPLAVAGRRPVLLVGDVLAPVGGVAGVVDLGDGDVRHETGRRGTVPVLFAGREEHAVAGVDLLDRPAARLGATGALQDEDRLAVRMRVPRCPRARREVDAAGV